MPTELDKTVDAPGGGNPIWNPGFLLSPAAPKVFPLVFSEFWFTEEGVQGDAAEIETPTADILVTLLFYEAKASGFSRTHSAIVTVKIYQSNGGENGEFSGSGRVGTPVTLWPQAFENAFVEAFMNFLQQLADNEQFIELAG